jgi:hypothetical protein
MFIIKKPTTCLHISGTKIINIYKEDGKAVHLLHFIKEFQPFQVEIGVTDKSCQIFRYFHKINVILHQIKEFLR